MRDVIINGHVLFAKDGDNEAQPHTREDLGWVKGNYATRIGNRSRHTYAHTGGILGATHVLHYE